MQEIVDLQHAIETLDAQRALLGDAVVNAALAPMRERLRQLQAEMVTEQRRLVTVLFCDLVDFTVLTRRLDAEDVREVVNSYFGRWTAAIERHNGVVEKFAGDAVMAVFGLVHSTDLDPIQAVRAALAMGRELELLNRRFEPQYGIRLQMRTGIHTGHAIVSTLRERRGQDFVIVGDTVNLASRLQALAPVNGIVISHATYQHVGREFDLQAFPPTPIKGFEQPIPYYVVTGEKPLVALAPHSASAAAPLVGRDRVFEQLEQAWHTVLAQHTGRLVAIIGAPGLGKSRVLLEFERRLRADPTPIHLFVGRALPAMRSVPYALLRDLFAQQFGIQDSDPPETVERKLRAEIETVLPDSPDAVALIGQLLGFTGGDPTAGRGQVEDPEVLQTQALARLSEYYMALAADRPIVALLEDLHWVDDSSLDILDRLLNRMAAGGPASRMLVVGTARPEMHERRPAWREGTAIVQAVELAPLENDESERLLRALLAPVADLPPRLVEQVTAAAEGNPYFVEELVKVLVEDGVIDSTVTPWVVDEARLAATRMPQTLTGVLQARLDSLQGEARLAVQQAAVIGRIFWDEAVAYLHAQAAAASTAATASAAADMTPVLTQMRATLGVLNDREFVFARGISSFERAQEYLFRHALMRDVAYSSVLKRTRRGYHSLAAQWLEEMTLRSRRTEEFAALIAGHYDMAEDAPRAARWYLQAGRQAARRFANTEALQAFNRALELLAPGKADGMAEGIAEQRFAVLAERERVYDLLGRRTEQGADLDQMAELAEHLDEPQLAAEAALRRSQYALDLGDYGTAAAAAEQAATLGRGLDAAGVEAAALVQLGQVLLRQGDLGGSLARMEQAYALAQAAGDRSLQADSLHGQAMAHVFLGNFDAAQHAFEAALAEAVAVGNRRLECVLLNRLSWVPTSRNEFMLAAHYAEQALELSRAIGDRMTEANALTNLGNAYIQISDYARGEAYSHQALDLYRALEDPAGEGAVLDNLGNAYWGRGEFVDALRYKQQALEIIRRIGDRQTETNIVGNLGIVATDMGDTAAAHAYLLRALELAQEDGNRWVESAVGTHLAVACLRRGDAEGAARHAQAAFDLATELGAQRDAINALNALGSAYLELGDAADALAVHRREEALATEAGLPDYAAGAVARQALALLALGDLAQAKERVEIVLEVLHKLTPNSIYAPPDLFLACARVLAAANDARLDDVLDLAHAWLQERLERLSDATHRAAFIDNIPAHAELMQAWRSRRQAAAAR